VKFIVTDKDVVIHEIDGLTGLRKILNFNYNGVPILGYKQLAKIVEHEATQKIKEKYLHQEVESVLNELIMVKLKVYEAKKVLKYVKFVEDET